MATSTAPTPLLSADQPRGDPNQDLLGYAPFAKLLAHSVLRGSPAAGLVVGLYGEWGLGKTTLLNFIEHFTRADAGDDAPIIVRFNPWWFSGREDLLRRFFKEFETTVQKTSARNAKVRKVLLGALEKIGDASSGIPSAWVATPGKLVAALARVGQKPADVVAIKEDLVRAMSAEALRVIVLIDDIDRLLPSEMIDIFRLVRSVGDFPNVHYVLAFDRAIVAKALSDECRTDGERYLEKIVQAPFELPRPTAATLHRMFTSRLDDVLAGTEEELFEQQRWSEVFLTGIATFLRTPRDVTRLLNALTVTYPVVRNEVNLVDFVAIETLRLFAPGAYDVLRSNRMRFVGLYLAVEHLQEENRAFHEDWLTRTERNADAVRVLVGQMFPRVAALLAKAGRLAVNDIALRKARRVCTEEVFDIYFRYSLDRGLSRSSFLNLLEADGAQLAATLHSFGTQRLDDGRTKLRWFLEMLRDELQSGRRLTKTTLLTELCRVGDSVIAATSRAFTFQVPDDLLFVFVVEGLLEQLPASERMAALRTALRVAGIATAARIVTILGAQHGRHGEQPTRAEARTIASVADVDALEADIRTRIEAAWASDALWSSPGLVRLLFDWKRLGGDAQVQEAVRRWTSASPGNLLRLLAEFSGVSSHGRAVIDLQSLSALLDLDETVAKARSIARDEAVDREARVLIQTLLDAYASTDSARRIARAREGILLAIVRHMSETDTYPESHAIRVAFEGERAVVDRLLEEQLIGYVNNDQYMINLGGLRAVASDPRATRQLLVCARLLTRLQAAYRTNEKATVDLEQLSAEMHEEDGALSLIELRRAAVVLQRSLGRAVKATADENGLPKVLTVSEAILNLSPEDVVGSGTPGSD